MAALAIRMIFRQPSATTARRSISASSWEIWSGTSSDMRQLTHIPSYCLDRTDRASVLASGRMAQRCNPETLRRRSICDSYRCKETEMFWPEGPRTDLGCQHLMSVPGISPIISSAVSGGHRVLFLGKTLDHALGL